MTLIVSAFFKENFIIAADRKQSPHPDEADFINLLRSSHSIFSKII